MATVGEFRNNLSALIARFGVNHGVEIVIPIGNGIAIVTMRNGRVLAHYAGDGVDLLVGHAPSAEGISVEAGLTMLKDGAHLTNFFLSGQFFDALDKLIFGHINLIGEEFKRLFA